MDIYNVGSYSIGDRFFRNLGTTSIYTWFVYAIGNTGIGQAAALETATGLIHVFDLWNNTPDGPIPTNYHQTAEQYLQTDDANVRLTRSDLVKAKVSTLTGIPI